MKIIFVFSLISLVSFTFSIKFEEMNSLPETSITSEDFLSIGTFNGSRCDLVFNRNVIKEKARRYIVKKKDEDVLLLTDTETDYMFFLPENTRKGGSHSSSQTIITYLNKFNRVFIDSFDVYFTIRTIFNTYVYCHPQEGVLKHAPKLSNTNHFKFQRIPTADGYKLLNGTGSFVTVDGLMAKCKPDRSYTEFENAPSI